LQGTTWQPAFSAHRGNFLAWFSSVRTLSCHSH
jgi:hypothetical protein